MHLGQSEWLPSAACSASEETIYHGHPSFCIALFYCVVLEYKKRKYRKVFAWGSLSTSALLHSISGLAVEKCCEAQILSQKIGQVLWQHVYVEAMEVQTIKLLPKELF